MFKARSSVTSPKLVMPVGASRFQGTAISSAAIGVLEQGAVVREPVDIGRAQVGIARAANRVGAVVVGVNDEDVRRTGRWSVVVVVECGVQATVAVPPLPEATEFTAHGGRVLADGFGDNECARRIL